MRAAESSEIDESDPLYGWERWTYENCTLLLKRQAKHPHALLRLAQILCSELSRPEEAQIKLNDLVRTDRDFEIARV
jgi:hypothetical protein